MQHVRDTIAALRRYICESEDRDHLEEVDALLGIAESEVRRKIASATKVVESAVENGG